METEAPSIEVSPCKTGGIILQRENFAVIIRRNPHHVEKMTTIRFIRSQGTQLFEADFSPIAVPFDEYDTQDPETRFGWAANVYLWLNFGSPRMQNIPEPAWPEIRRFASFLAACIEEHETAIDS